MHVGPQIARIERQDPKVRVLDGEDGAEVVERRLRGAVRPPSGVGLDRGVRGQVHDRPARTVQGGEQFLDQGQRRHQVGLEHRPQLARIQVGELGERRRTERPGVVDQQVKAAELLDRATQRRAVRGVGHVARDGTERGLGRSCPEVAGGLFEGGRVAAIDHDGPALFGEALAECAPVPTGGAGDECGWHRCDPLLGDGNGRS